MDVLNITIKYIPALFPTINFTDSFNVPNTRLLKLPESFIEKFETNEKFAKIGQSITTNQLIQTIVYQKYMFEFQATEHISIDTMQLGDEVTLIDENNVTYNVRITDLEVEKAGDTTLYLHKISFINLEDDTNVISNYMEQAHLVLRYEPDELYKIVLSSTVNIDSVVDFANGAIVDFYTVLKPKLNRTEMESQTNKLNSGLSLISQSTDLQTTRVKIFLNETNKLKLLKYGKRCTAKLMNVDENVTYVTSVQPIDIQAAEENSLVDLYEFDVIFYSDLTKFYHYAN